MEEIQLRPFFLSEELFFYIFIVQMLYSNYSTYIIGTKFQSQLTGIKPIMPI